MFKTVAIAFLLLVALFLGHLLKPDLNSLNSTTQPDFEQIIPKQFSDWTIIDDIPVIIADPEMQNNIDEIYSQTVTRTYINKNNEAIMLSIAYGVDQSDSMQVHKPEVCYPAQGFNLLKSVDDILNINGVQIPIRKLNTQLRNRNEFVTYWILVGDRVIAGNLGRKLHQLKYGFKGEIPSGLLFRVSSIGSDETKEFLIQENFTKELLENLSDSNKKTLIGIKGSE